MFNQQSRSNADAALPEIQHVALKENTEKVSFNRDIRPILTENCYACHGPDAHEAKADVQLHSAKLAHDDFVIVPGEPAESEAWLRIIDEEDPMPPKKSHKVLTAEQKDLVKRWIEQGAEYEEHWAYITPELTQTPAVKDQAWPKHWIDSYILAGLEDKGIEPVADADRVTLIRRLSFDLTGLPPTPEEVEAFVNDKSPNAHENLIDRLLQSPHFGERLAIYWLDIVRFADTVGYHGDQTMSITPYRDWVIWAFNENLPYDQFMKYQVAGDLIEDPTGHALIASAYNRLHQTSHEGGLQRKEYEAIYDADRVRNFSEAFMGATIGCAQCHDHKYDPYTDEDFYALAAFFGQMDDLEHLAPYDGSNFGKGTNKNPTWREPTATVLSPLDKQRKAALEAHFNQTPDEQIRKTIQAEIDAIKPRKVMISKQRPPEKFRPVRFLARGNWADETGEIMKPAIPSFMGELDVQGTPTRLHLAQWLTKPEQEGGIGELNARVMVNRLWYLMFGEGLCTTLGDFGGQGMPPNHPELLDRLAIEFVGSGWDIKAMLKKMAMTRTYRLSTEPTEQLLRVDQNNELFARQSQRRLPAEMIRDNALLVSGLMVDQLGGESARPYQPVGYYMHLNFPKRKYKQDEDLNQWRRGVYMHWQRQFLHPMLKAFDAPSREECTAKRPISNTPLAALVALNDPSFVEAARNFSQRVLTEAKGGDRSKLDWAMMELLSRKTTDREAELILTLLNENRSAFSQSPASAEALISVGLSPRDEKLNKTEHAAWTEVCRVLLNLHETITRP
ncbi:MAG: PSD1 and planctomycete cytochrome C domain-containing protein [Phycisphaeraceae bacterium]|nr:PSD1 and planctomycete cytochrome C domain-containing protein [Phycisphaeraceae bacterium]